MIMPAMRSLRDTTDNVLMQAIRAPTNPIIVIANHYIDNNERDLGLEPESPIYYYTIEDKEAEFRTYNLNDCMLFVWEGRNRTDVFEIQRADIIRILDLL